MNSPVYILDALRTPVGAQYRSLKDHSAAKLASVVMRELVRRNKLKPTDVEEVVLGNTVSAGTGQNLARQALIMAGIADTTPSYLVNNVCGAGLQSVVTGAQSILCGDRNLLITGGTESASQSPTLKFEYGQEIEQTESVICDGLWCHLTNRHMGELCEHIVGEFHISRKDQDFYSCESHRKAVLAQESRKFDSEIVAVPAKDGKTLNRDERVRKNLDLKAFQELPPSFKKDGTVTAGNSSAPSDGAAAILLASEEWVRTHKRIPKAKILGYAKVAVKPTEVFAAGPAAIRECLKKSGLSFDDVDLFEVGEAFAAQAIVTQKKAGIPAGRMNIYGGDVAMGHPLGAAGARILVTLIHALEQENRSKGIACICFGGGGAIAVAIQRMNQ